jgi:hypothetical protein
MLAQSRVRGDGAFKRAWMPARAHQLKRSMVGSEKRHRTGGYVEEYCDAVRRGRLTAWAVAAAVPALLGCGTAASRNAVATSPDAAAASPSGLAHWIAFTHVSRPLDLAGPRADGSLVLAAAGRLMLVRPGGTIVPYATGYRSPGGEEPYIALSPGGCFGVDVAYALRLRGKRGVVSVGPGGAVRRLATLTAPGLIDGIAFDRTGAFAHRLLVTINAGSRTTVDAIDCRGTVTEITASAPRVEGGIAVAPSSFGRFAGDLIAPDETGGRIFAITPAGASELLAPSGLPHGGDVGVESEAFVPNGLHLDAFLADRLTPGNRHPGDDVVLRLTHAALTAAGVRPGDLLVATEGGARTDAVRCGQHGCQVRHVADGPAIAHAEGHIAFAALG